MAKRTAVIDLGSNSMRMAIFERTSRWAFFTLDEYKTKIRLAAGRYQDDKSISQESMKKAVAAFGEFKAIAKRLKCAKIFAVGTSALRDAPNKDELIRKVLQAQGISLRAVSGKMEAAYGAVATANLLFDFERGVTIDIGGGSTELALIENGKILQAISLDIGTVRLKELFFDTKNTAGLKEFLSKVLEQIPAQFRCAKIIAIGGSLRALAGAIMAQSSYPLYVLHGFEYELKKHEDFLASIANSPVLGLDKFGIKKERFDTIREGAHIFLSIAKYLGAKSVITSGVGVREGVYLSDVLKLEGLIKKGELNVGLKRFPSGLNPNLKSLLDRYRIDNNKPLAKIIRELFAALEPLHKLDKSYLGALLNAASLVNIGANIGFYSDHKNAAYLVLNSLNYGYTHSQKALIACILGTNGKKSVYEFERLKELLPSESVVRWLSFILYLGRALLMGDKKELSFAYSNQTLKIAGAKGMLLAKDEIKKLAKPDIFAITFI